MTKILIVDDDEGICSILSEVLTHEGYDVTYALTGEEGVKKYRAELPSVLLLDLKLPGMDGLSVLREVMTFDPEAIVIMITGYGSVDSAVGAIRLGAVDYMQKPVSNTELTIKIQNALHNRMLTKELYYLKEYVNKRFSMNNIVRESEAMVAAVDMLQRIAAYDKPLLIAGEPGTGKDLAAWAAHHSGRRKEKPMVMFDCSAYPPNMIQTELFGDMTPGMSRKIGKVEEAHLGTLYLDRIDWLPSGCQEKILNVVQHKGCKHPTTDEIIPCDVHLVASTSSNLALLSRQGKFNRQLFDLLHQYEITLPPLKERETDIAPLAVYFLEEANEEFNLSITGFDAPAMRKLLNHTWPGNVRELRNVVRAAANLATDLIQESDITIHGQ